MNELVFTRLAGDLDSGRLLVVGPSLGTSVEALWGRCARLLGDRYEVVGWDLPGHGRSQPAAGPFTIGDLADVVRDRAERLAGARPAYYAGVSLGGVLAFELGMDPGPFEATVAVAAVPRIGDAQSWRERAALVRRAGAAVMVGPSSGRWFAPGFAARDPATVGELLNGLARTDSSSYAWACEALADHHPEPRLGDTNVPVLIAPGAEDTVIDLAAARAALGAIPGATCHALDGCGHLPPAEEPTATATVLREYFEEVGHDPQLRRRHEGAPRRAR